MSAQASFVRAGVPVPPTAISLRESAIGDDAIPGTFASLIRSVDANLDETHSYQLVAGEGDGDNVFFAISGNQLLAAQPFAGLAGTNVSLRLRSTDSGGLSFDQALALSVVAVAPAIVINEIHYDPADNLRSEFVELHNPTGTAVDVGGWRLAGGVAFTFPAGTMIPVGGYLVVAQDTAVFQSRFGFLPLGPFAGKLSGEADDVELRDAHGAAVDEVSYKAEFPWPIDTSGNGPSMELIHPSLDNNLGSSWRASQPPGGQTERTLLPAGDPGWRYRPGASEASDPVNVWRSSSFIEDGTWMPHATPVGYGTVNGLTLALPLITGMQNNYTCIFLRNRFVIAPGEMPQSLRLHYTVDDGMVVWINGFAVTRKNMNNDENAANAEADASGAEGTYYDEVFEMPVSFLVEGMNTVAVQVFNRPISNSDLGFEMEIVRLASAPMIGQPTPGARNSVFSPAAPPNIRQVRHSPEQPRFTDPTVVTAKISDPQGVGSVDLRYQIVAPGNFIPARFPRTVPQILADPEGERPANPSFENPANWTTLSMRDDGTGGDVLAADGVFTATIPAQPHRTLVRYRLVVVDLPGTSVRVPYADDPSLNFAYFVYNGVPDYVATSASVHPEGAGHVWPKELLTSVPVYHWLIRNQDMLTLQAYNGSEQFTNNGTAAELGARRAFDWEGAFVYDGKVYDHARARLRGGNSRYGDFDGRFPRGKRHYKFRFNAGNYFQARDEKGRPYETKWRIFNVGRMFGTKGGNSWGLPEEVGETLWQTFGVPAQRAHWFQFRVIDGAAEAPDQYNGDFWGLQQAQERYDVRFLEARNLPKGNLYKLSDWIFDAERQRRYQSADMVSDGSEFTNIWNNLHGAQSASWLNDHVNFPLWYRYNAVAEAIRHYDIFPWIDTSRHGLKNWVWHFTPTGVDPSRGVVSFYPYDWDASWGPNFNNGWDHANNALYGFERFGKPYVDKPEMKIEHRNVLREFRDLIWQPDQVNGLLDDRAAVIAELSRADQDRWRNAPVAAGTANDDPLTFKLQDMKNFAFTGWSGGSGPTVGAGGRASYLDSIADNPDSGQLPARPVITYLGEGTHPTDGIAFRTSPFSDPQGAGTFGAMVWRIGEIEDPTAPAFDPADDFILEYTPVWESGLLGVFSNEMAVPGSVLRVGHTYRARVRVQDTTGRWSHWSLPYQFTTGAPIALGDLQGNLMITEIMYHPANPSAAERAAGFLDDGDFEYLELRNINTTLTLNLADVRFTKGIDFSFLDGSVTTLAPGAYILVVKRRAAFEFRYGPGLPVAGEWAATESLNNSGERLKLSHGAGTAIHDFVYDDASPWPTSPDGGGASLVLADPLSAPDHALAASWRASAQPFGSPGTADIGGFTGWLASHGETEPNARPSGGPLTNAMVYALGADLASDAATILPSASVQPGVGADEHLVFTYRRRAGAADASYAVEVSSDMVLWQSGSTFTEEVGVPDENGDGTETVTVLVLVPVASDSRAFARLKVEIAL